MPMNKNLFAVLGALAVSDLVAMNGLAQAPAEKKPEPRPGSSAVRPPPRDIVEMWAQRLNLTEAQKPKVKALFNQI